VHAANLRRSAAGVSAYQSVCDERDMGGRRVSPNRPQKARGVVYRYCRTNLMIGWPPSYMPRFRFSCRTSGGTSVGGFQEDQMTHASYSSSTQLTPGLSYRP
jgi:hypothetical protein